MNPIDFEFLAFEALQIWKQTHTTGCVLVLDNDKVLAIPPGKAPPNHPGALTITKHECNVGLTARSWINVGCALFRLSERNQPCPKPPKLLPSPNSTNS